jgi:hypothetical protein
MLPTDPLGTNVEYGDFLGLGSIMNSHLDYIQRNHELQSRISPTRCYLLQMKPTGSIVGNSTSPITVTSDMYLDTEAPMSFVLWNGTGEHPDLRPYVGDGAGAITILVGGVPMTRILNKKDLRNSLQFAVEKRFDLDPQRVEVHFYSTFDMTGSVVQYYYESMYKDVRPDEMNRPTANAFSLYGWRQYKKLADNWRNANQILVRMPMTVASWLTMVAEGKVRLEENQCWTVGVPYLNDGDILVVPVDQNPTGEIVWFEVVNKSDSIIQFRLMSQRFKVKLIPPEDERTNISYSMVYP